MQLSIKMMGIKVLNFLLFGTILVEVYGHGRLMDPPNRSSLWRINPEMPVNYKDDELWCGGHKHADNQGLCGVCGDDFTAPHPQPNENTGIYGGGIVMASYQSGNVVEVVTHITANHLGNIQYHLCKIRDLTKPETGEECFKLLQFADGSNQTEINKWDRVVHSEIQLPEGVTCSQCVLRLTYNADGFWGSCDSSGNCGPRIIFRSCSDIEIV